jgi:hypothetical protein
MTVLVNAFSIWAGHGHAIGAGQAHQLPRGSQLRLRREQLAGLTRQL